MIEEAAEANFVLAAQATVRADQKILEQTNTKKETPLWNLLKTLMPKLW